MKIKRPSAKQIRALAKENHFTIRSRDLPAFQNFIDLTIKSHENLAGFPETKPESKYSRSPGHVPLESENPYGAWAWKSVIKEKESGLLVGKKIAIKDNVSVAGIPLMNGTKLMRGYVPDIDASIVTRILNAGGEIRGKAICENMCFSGGSETSYPWPVKNPRNLNYMAGGSSSGSAALIAAGEIDMAIGGDQAGSIRIPSSWCGVYGMKPTWGLVPYTGIVPLEPSIDHAGPMGKSVADVALLLEAIAGRDKLDPRQMYTQNDIPSYTNELEKGIGGMKIGIVNEGFGWEGVSDNDVDEIVKQSAGVFQDHGARLSEISIPMHRRGIDIWTGIIVDGAWNMLIRDDGAGRYLVGYYDSNLANFFSKHKLTRADDMASSFKAVVILANYLAQKYHHEFYYKSQNLRYSLRRAYDEAFDSVDLLLMPTTPQKAQLLKTGDLDYTFKSSANTIPNTCPFDVTGHPAMNVPCGKSGDGLPIGMMLIGRHFDEVSILRAAMMFERSRPLSELYQ